MSVSYYSRELVFTGDVGPDAESIYSLIFTSSLYIISAVIPNYTGFKTIIVATVIGCVSRLLSRSKIFFLLVVWYFAARLLSRLGALWVHSRGSQSGVQGHLATQVKRSQGVRDFAVIVVKSTSLFIIEFL